MRFRPIADISDLPLPVAQMSIRRIMVALFVLAIAGAYFTGCGWLVREKRFPAEAGKGGGECRYQTLKGIRVAYYLGDCPRFSMARFS